MTTKLPLRPLAIALLTALFFWFFPAFETPAGAQEAQTVAATPATAPGRAPALVRLDDAKTGSLLLRTADPGRFLEAPRVATDVSIDVTGLIVRARVTQRFENPSDQWVEGVYVYPLPNEAGVDRLRMMIGDRFIEGRIEERQEARRIYEEAREAGVRAGLVEQERPNIFTNSVANIGPRETVVVQIEYQEIARLKDGAFSFRLPLVVGPRYSPLPDLIQTVDFNPATGFALNDPVPDRARISPPVMRPEHEPGVADGADPDGEMRLPVSISIDLRAGFPLGEVTSLYHDVVTELRDEETRATIALADGAVPANRDFVLEWRPADGALPQAAAFTETRADGTYLLAMVVPPTELRDEAERRPREAIFVIDNSGSMAGPSMPQAKAALVMALDRLTPEDTFNVVRFDDTYDVLFRTAVPATPTNVARAQGYVEGLEAEGGTEMLPALQAALIDPSPNDATRVRQVVFLTDGAIGNEDQLFAAIDAGLGRSRLFTVGIGTAPNTFFMARAARLGRGTFTHIGDLAEVQTKAEALFAALETPVMTDLAAEPPADLGAPWEIWPDPLPDLYAGEPVVLTAKISEATGRFRVSGLLAGRRWAADLDVADAAQGVGVAQAWARSKIEAIEERRFTGGDVAEIDAQVLKTALAYGLVSRLTSLVAVDVTPARPDGAPLASVDVPTMLPEGWAFEKVFGPDIAPAPFMRDAGLPRDAMLIDSTVLHASADVNGLLLPQGATTAQLQMLLGLMLATAALAFLAWRRWRARVWAPRLPAPR